MARRKFYRRRPMRNPRRTVFYKSTAALITRPASTGKSLLIFRNRVKPPESKIFRFRDRANHWMNRPVSPDKRGGSRSSRNARRDAVDADVPRTNGMEAYGEVVWSRRPDAGVKFAESFASDGGKKARSPRRARYKP